MRELRIGTANQKTRHSYRQHGLRRAYQRSTLRLTAAYRESRLLKKTGFLERDAENSYLALEPDDDAMAQQQGHSITYRIAVGRHNGLKDFTLQTL